MLHPEHDREPVLTRSIVHPSLHRLLLAQGARAGQQAEHRHLQYLQHAEQLLPGLYA